MKIAYISIDDPRNHISWSGLKLNIYKTLKSLKHDILPIGPLRNVSRLPFVLKREFYKKINIKYDSERKISLSKKYSKRIMTILKNKKIDLIFTSDTYLTSFLKTDIPIILWLDVTYKTYYNHYFDKKKFHRKSFQEANFLEKLALDKAKKIILTSSWSKKQTVKNYKINPKKIHILPFGSNLKNNKKINFNKSKKNYLSLLSVGVDWERKGMEKSINITKYLNKIGIDTKLNIIGGNNKKKFPKYIIQHGFLDKNIKKDYLTLKKLFISSDIHILMTIKEAAGVVFAEANSFGLFNITNDVGGVRGMIKNNINGKLFKINDDHKKIAKYISKIFKDKKIFKRLKKNSYKYYIKELSWNANSKKIQKILLSVLKK